MKIVISAIGPGLDDAVDPRFGRCSYFQIIDTHTGLVEAIANENAAAGGGAGIKSAQMMVDRGVGAVLTGNCGPNAFDVFNAAGIHVYPGTGGTVREAIEKFKSGNLQQSSAPSVANHFGMGRNQ